MRTWHQKLEFPWINAMRTDDRGAFGQPIWLMLVFAKTLIKILGRQREKTIAPVHIPHYNPFNPNWIYIKWASSDWRRLDFVAAQQKWNVWHKKCINYANHLRGKQEGKIENASTFLPRSRLWKIDASRPANRKVQCGMLHHLAVCASKWTSGQKEGPKWKSLNRAFKTAAAHFVLLAGAYKIFMRFIYYTIYGHGERG